MKEQRKKAAQARAMDWTELHRRIQEAQSAAEHGVGADPESGGILESRARSLAKEPEKKEASEEHLEVVKFLLGREKYALETSFVREVYPLRDLTYLPCVPAFVRGIINVRGQILCVIDLRRMFGLSDSEVGPTSKVIVVRDGRMELGIVADMIVGVHAIPERQIQATLPTLTDICAEYLRGVTSDQVAILDVEAILADKRIIVHEELEG